MKRHFCFIVLMLLLSSQALAYQQLTKISKPATTYNVAQVVEWINDDVFVVGRWDGTISVFREPIVDIEYGPVIIQSFTTPGRKGIEMLQKVGESFVVSSNTSSSMTVWRIHKDILTLDYILQYNPKLGTANSSTDLMIDGKLYLIAGHANGYVSQWLYDGQEFKLLKEVDVRTPSSPANPFELYNIRGVVPFKNDLAILASEDGDISLYKLSTGKIVLRKRYNDSAKRGINSISYDGEYLLLGNCSVGVEDKNIWLYKVSDKSIELLESINLVKDSSLEQVFNFDVELLRNNEKNYFYASTGEGLIWFGEIEGGHIKPIDSAKVTAEGGAALDIDPDKNNIAAVAHSIQLYNFITKP